VYALRIIREMPGDLFDGCALAGAGHHTISIELCSASSRLSLRSTLPGFGLDDACAQLEGSTYVMAEEARHAFSH
jgi:hypothetical protein